MVDHVDVSVEQDHIEKLAKIKNPVVPIEELIWNGLDADATCITVRPKFGTLGALEEIEIKDNGCGIARTECERAFGNLGGSKKIKHRYTPNGRVVHGQLGQGRFRAFGLGRKVTWISRYKADDIIESYTIVGHRSDLKRFQITDGTIARSKKTGVSVIISEFDKNFGKLGNSREVADELAQRLALYLKKYPGISIHYDGVLVDASTPITYEASYALKFSDNEGKSHDAELTVIEWKRSTNRAVYLCDENGFTLNEVPPGIHARGYNFTAYVKSSYLRQMAEDDRLELHELDPVITELVTHVKKQLKDHFRARDAFKSNDLVVQWLSEKVYPYETLSTDPLQKVEREVFDVVAVKVNDYLPNFESTDSSNKKFVFRLLREAIAANPTSVQAILRQVLNLPKEHQDELAKMLDRTHLSAIINASKTVMDRLDFIASMDEMIFGAFKDSMLERTQLHRILAEELWIFGEQYALAVDDQSLTRVLEAHIEILGRQSLADTKVLDLDGKKAIVDLMLAKSIPQLQPNHFEHLVVELKRPNCTIGQAEISQIEKYAFKVASDSRFDRTRTKWKFVLIGKELDDFASQKCSEKNREFGHIYNTDGLDIYVYRWSTIIEEAKWRYGFFREKLELEVSSNNGLEYLRAKHAEFLPEA